MRRKQLRIIFNKSSCRMMIKSNYPISLSLSKKKRNLQWLHQIKCVSRSYQRDICRRLPDLKPSLRQLI